MFHFQKQTVRLGHLCGVSLHVGLFFLSLVVMAYAFVEHTFGLLGRGSKGGESGVALCQIGQIIAGGHIEQRIANAFLGTITGGNIMQSLLGMPLGALVGVASTQKRCYEDGGCQPANSKH